MLERPVVNIVKSKEQREHFQSDNFWCEFIAKAAKAKVAEPQLWDVKETLTICHAKGSKERQKAKVAFAEDEAHNS